jgi:hypothetical protein
MPVKGTELCHVSADSETCYNYYSNVQTTFYWNVTPSRPHYVHTGSVAHLASYSMGC